MGMRQLAGLAICFSSLTGAAPGQRITAEEREDAVVQLAEKLVEYYVFEDVAEECADQLYERLAEGAYDDKSMLASFAHALTDDLQKLTKDKHLRVMPGGMRSMPEHPEEEGGEHQISPEQRRQMARSNFGFQRVEILPGNVGYLDLRGFQDVSVAGDTVHAAMSFLANADAVAAEPPYPGLCMKTRVFDVTSADEENYVNMAQHRLHRSLKRKRRISQGFLRLRFRLE